MDTPVPIFSLEAGTGIEPVHNGFADHRVTSSPSGHDAPHDDSV